MQESRIDGTAVQREEGDIGEPGEPLQRASDLTAGVEAERPGTDLVHDDRHRSLADQTPQLCMVP